MNPLLRLINSLITEIRNRPEPYAAGTVATVDAATTPPTVTVNWNGATVEAACPRNLTPAVGQAVLLARFGSQLLILNTY